MKRMTPEEGYTVRINHMHKDDLCTVIDVNFMMKEIRIQTTQTICCGVHSVRKTTLIGRILISIWKADVSLEREAILKAFLKN